MRVQSSERCRGQVGIRRDPHRQPALSAADRLLGRWGEGAEQFLQDSKSSSEYNAVDRKF